MGAGATRFLGAVPTGVFWGTGGGCSGGSSGSSGGTKGMVGEAMVELAGLGATRDVEGQMPMSMSMSEACTTGLSWKERSSEI